MEINVNWRWSPNQLVICLFNAIDKLGNGSHFVQRGRRSQACKQDETLLPSSTLADQAFKHALDTHGVGDWGRE